MQVTIQMDLQLDQGSYGSSKLNHLYGYVSQNPINKVDLYGLFEGCIEIAPNVYSCSSGGPENFNTGDASAFSDDSNNHANKECMEKCMEQEMNSVNVTCLLAGEAISRRATSVAGMIGGAACNYITAKAACNIKCNDDCPE